MSDAVDPSHKYGVSRESSFQETERTPWHTDPSPRVTRVTFASTPRYTRQIGAGGLNG